MKSRTTIAPLATSLTLTVATAFSALGCAASTHATQPSSLGTARGSGDFLSVIDEPGPIEAESVVSTKWEVTRAGLINLDAPKAKAAGLTDEDEHIEVYFHVIRHPRFGTYI